MLSRTLLALGLLSVEALIESPNSKQIDIFKNFLMNTNVFSSSQFATVGIIGSEGLAAEWFIKNKVLPDHPMMLWHNKNPKAPPSTYRTKDMFAFLQDKADFAKFLVFVDECPFLHRRGQIRFVISNRVEETSWLKSALVLIWKIKILNYVIVFNLAGELKIAGYNPFNETSYFLKENDVFFPNKLKDLYKYSLRVAMVEDAPRNVMKDGTLFGEDMLLLNAVCNKLNASLNVTIVPEFSDVKNMILNETVDFSFNRFIIIANMIEVAHTYPFTPDNIVVVVPKSQQIPTYMYIFYTFDIFSWICITSATALFMVIDKLILAISGKESHSYTILLIALMYFLFLIPSAFQCSLTSAMTKPKYLTDIDTIPELYNSPYKISITNSVFGVFQEVLKVWREKFVLCTRYEMLNNLKRGNVSTGYLNAYSFFQKIPNRRNSKGDLVFHLVEDYLVPGYTVYPFPVRSPFKNAIDIELAYFIQYEIKHLLLDRKQVVEDEELEPVAMLSFAHFQSAFILLAISYVICVGVCVLEIVVYKNNKIKK